MISSFIPAFPALFSGLFSGASVYINVAEHPARMECGTQLATTVFPKSYARASVLQISYVLLTSASGVLAYYSTKDVCFLFTAGGMFSIIPYTMLLMMPTNKKLMQAAKDQAFSPATNGMLVSWNQRHLVRSVVSIAMFVANLGLLVKLRNHK